MLTVSTSAFIRKNLLTYSVINRCLGIVSLSETGTNVRKNKDSNKEDLCGALSEYYKNYHEILLPPLNGSGVQCAVGTVAGDPVTLVTCPASVITIQIISRYRATTTGSDVRSQRYTQTKRH